MIGWNNDQILEIYNDRDVNEDKIRSVIQTTVEFNSNITEELEILY